ncbi:MAG: hypothetical protein ACF8Q5_09335 [Phycisphaerales bacterium JB040]
MGEMDLEGKGPRDARGLARFVRERFGLELASEAVVPGHATGLEYLCHAFFEDSVPRDCVVWANRGGGKTYLGAVATALDLVFKPGIEVRVLAGSLEQASRMNEHLRAIFELEGFEDLVSGRVTERRIKLINGSRVELLASSQTSVRGTRVQKLRCDEVELVDPEVWEAAQLVTREKVCAGVYVPGSIECLSTMHVPHGIMQRLVRSCVGPGEGDEGDALAGFAHENASGERLRATRRLFRWGVLDVLGECSDEHACDSCVLHQHCRGRVKERDARGGTPGHVSVGEALRLMGRVGRETWESEMLCLRPSRANAVLPEFDVKTHVVDSLPAGDGEGWVWVCAVDFGIRAPTVVLWAGVDPAGVVWVCDERSVAGEVLDRHLDAIVSGRPRGEASEREHPFPEWVGIDPAGRQRSDQTGISNAAVMQQRGLTVRDRRMGLGEGLRLVRARLRPAVGSPRLFVHRRCAGLIGALETYHYPSERPESDVPVKDGSDHSVDALRYLVQNLDRPYRVTRREYA